MGKYNGKTCRLISIMGLVLAYFFAEVIVGYVIQSLSLVADAFHMLSDLIALVIGLISTRLTRMPRTSRNTFGWQRADVVGTLINTVILSTLCFTIVVRAVERFIEPHSVHNPKLMVGVGIGGLVINLISMTILLTKGHGHSHGHPYQHSPVEINEDASLVNLPNQDTPPANQVQQPNNIETNYASVEAFNQSITTQSKETDVGIQNDEIVRKRNSVKKRKEKEHSDHHHSHGSESMNMKAVLLHVVADTIGSFFVVVSAVILWLVPAEATWKIYVDPGTSLLMVAIIMYSTVKLLKQSALILLQSVPKNVKVKTIVKEIETIVGSNKVHDLHIWRLQSDCIIGTVHIRCKDLADYVISSRSVKAIFHQSDIHCTTIQPEFDEHESPHSTVMRNGHCALNCGPDETCNQTTCCPTSNTQNADTNSPQGDSLNPIASV
uniref:Slc30a-7 n=1 Tax=Schmidtea mediterranea TaxID=79327 RepID=A0A0H3YFI4_SCHMD|nr:slc30a-7 [Schmidtea mediterranea]